MALISNINFAYPILCNYNDDYIIDFKCGTVNGLRKTKLSSFIDIVVDLKDQNLINLISSKKAKIILKVYCSSTKFRTIVELNQGMNEITIRNRDINKKVLLQTYIIATDNLDNYCSDNFNEDYKNIKFSIEKGSILAVGETEEVNIEKDIDELSTVNSIIKIKDSHQDDIPMFVEYDTDYIKIYLSNKSYKTYACYSKFEYLPIINSMIIIPGIMDVLDKVAMDYDSEVEDKKWFRVISKKISQATGREFNIDYIKTHGSFEIIQKIFDCPIIDSMKLIDKNYGGN